MTDAARTLLAGARRSRRPAAEAMPAGRLARAEAVLSSMSAILLSRRVRTREAEVTLVRQKDGFRETARNSRDGTKLAISNSRRDVAFFLGSVTPSLARLAETRGFGGKTVPDYFPCPQ